MDRRFLAAVVASVALLAAGIGAGIYLGGTGSFDERQRVDPAVTSFSAGNVTCTDAASTAPTVDVGNTTKGSFLVVRTNVTLPDASTRLTNATLAERGLANYTLTLEDEQSDGDQIRCPSGESPVSSAQVVLQLPHPGDEPFGVTTVYRGETLFRVRNGPAGFEVTTPSENGSAG